MPFSIGPMELVIVLVLALIVLGPKRLPEAAKSLGKGMREFKDSIAGGGANEDDEPAAIPVAARANSAATMQGWIPCSCCSGSASACS